jgi:tetratricopeptide (TPR) repeat protein
MTAKIRPNFKPENLRTYHQLVSQIEASVGVLSLLIAVCDDLPLRDRIIGQYEQEIQPEMQAYRLTLDTNEPSLKRALTQLVNREEALQRGEKAVLTVTGTEKLLFISPKAERTEVEKFLGYLQWTREGLREFPYPVVLWVTYKILGDLSLKAPDFWSWRKGVFRFVQETEVIPAIPDNINLYNYEIAEKEDTELLPLEDLADLIARTEKRNPKDRKLGGLYDRLGRLYCTRLKRGEAEDYAKELELAFSCFRKAISLQSELGLKTDLVNSLIDLGLLYHDQSQDNQAIEYYQKSLKIAQEIGDREGEANVLNNLGNAYRSLEQYQEAEPLYQRALAITEAQLGATHPDTATSLNNLAGLYWSMGRYQEAEPLYQRALAIREAQLGATHPNTAASLNNLAGLYESMGRYQEAEPLHQRALAITEAQLGATHPHTARSLNNLALLYQSMGRYQEAEPLHQRALAITEAQLGATHPHTATSLNSLAELYRLMGRYQEAEPLHQRALAITEAQLGATHPHTARSLNNLALLYQSMGRYQEAEPLHQRALAITEAQLGATHPDTATSLNNLAGLYLYMGRYQEAEPFYLRAVAIFYEMLGENHPHTQTVLNNYVRMLAKAIETGQIAGLQQSGSDLTQQLLAQMLNQAEEGENQ